MSDAKSNPKIPPEIAALLRDEKWAQTFAKLTNYAHKRMRRTSLERAREMAQEAITRLYDGEYVAWDPKKEPLFLYLTSMVNSQAFNERTKASTQNETRITTKIARQLEQMPADVATPEDEVIARDFQVRTWTEIRANIGDDALVDKLADCVESGVDAPAEQAQTLGEPIEEVRKARRRFFAHVEKVTRSLQEESP